MQLSGLTDLQNDLLRTSKNVQKEMPKIMRKVGSKARTVVAKRARKDVKKLSGNYHKSWKRGKVFVGNDGSFIVRVFNSSPHAHLIEYGYRMVSETGEDLGRFVHGKKVLDKGMQEFEASDVAEEMLSDWLDELLADNKL